MRPFHRARSALALAPQRPGRRTRPVGLAHLFRQATGSAARLAGGRAGARSSWLGHQSQARRLASPSHRGPGLALPGASGAASRRPPAAAAPLLNPSARAEEPRKQARQSPNQGGRSHAGEAAGCEDLQPQSPSHENRDAQRTHSTACFFSGATSDQQQDWSSPSASRLRLADARIWHCGLTCACPLAIARAICSGLVAAPAFPCVPRSELWAHPC